MVFEQLLTSVQEYNEEQNDSLEYEFVKVESCQTKEVAGFKYKLSVEFQTVGNQIPAFYELMFYVIPWENSVELQSIEKLAVSGGV